jgi:hypothetical protein
LTVLDTSTSPGPASAEMRAPLEKEFAIDELIDSPNFRATHLAIQKLSSFVDFSGAQAKSLVEAALANSQIRQIAYDRDVKTFYESLLAIHEPQLESATVSALRSAMTDPLSDESGDADV